MRRAARRDLVEPEIVAALRKAGIRVTIASIAGFPDLVTWNEKTGTLLLLEVKSADGKLTPLQKKKTAQGWPVVVVRTVQEALQAVGVQ